MKTLHARIFVYRCLFECENVRLNGKYRIFIIFCVVVSIFGLNINVSFQQPVENHVDKLHLPNLKQTFV